MLLSTCAPSPAPPWVSLPEAALTTPRPACSACASSTQQTGAAIGVRGGQRAGHAAACPGSVCWLESIMCSICMGQRSVTLGSLPEEGPKQRLPEEGPKQRLTEEGPKQRLPEEGPKQRLPPCRYARLRWMRMERSRRPPSS